MNTTTASSETFLTFRLGEELFAMPVGCVREILDPCRITRVPGSPSHMLGVINVRGITTAVMDLSRRFGLGPARSGPDTRIIIMEFPLQDQLVVVGGQADAVKEVLEIPPGEVAPAPSVGMRWKCDYIRGITHQAGRYIIILEIERLLLSEEAGPETAAGTRS